MQAVDGQNSSPLEWHQDGGRTRPDGTFLTGGSGFGGRSRRRAASGDELLAGAFGEKRIPQHVVALELQAVQGVREDVLGRDAVDLDGAVVLLLPDLDRGTDANRLDARSVSVAARNRFAISHSPSWTALPSTRVMRRSVTADPIVARSLTDEDRRTSCSAQGVRATRKPPLLLMTAGVAPTRAEDRHWPAGSYQDPPRITRLVPVDGPGGLLVGLCE